MKMVKLTNTGHLAGMPIWINAEQITAIFELATDSGSLATHVFGGATGIDWVVAEGPKEILLKIKLTEKI